MSAKPIWCKDFKSTTGPIIYIFLFNSALTSKLTQHNE